MRGRFYRHYTAFQRNILAEFMTKKELNEIDRKYNEAKIIRGQKLLAESYKRALKRIKESRKNRLKEIKYHK